MKAFGLAVLVLALSVGGIACAEPVAIGDLRDLSGTWTGEIRVDEQRVPLSVSITDDGQARVESRGVRGRSVLTLETGRVVWHGLQKPVIATLQREGATRVLHVECIDGTCRGELRAAAASTGSGAAPGAVRAAPAAPTPPPSPGRLSLAWKMPPGTVQGFIVERKTGEENFRAVRRLLSPHTTWADESVHAGSVYCYRVRSVSRTGTSVPSEEACATAAPRIATAAASTGPPVPAAPAPPSPPAGRPIALKDAAPLVGRWRGEIRSASGLASLAIVFARDGTARWSVDDKSGVGAFTLDGGKIRWRAGNSSATGELYEQLGKRVIRLTCDDGSCTASLSREDPAGAGCQDCGDKATRASGRSIPATSTRVR